MSFVKLASIRTSYNDSCKFNRKFLKIKRVAQFKSALHVARGVNTTLTYLTNEFLI